MCSCCVLLEFFLCNEPIVISGDPALRAALAFLDVFGLLVSVSFGWRSVVISGRRVSRGEDKVISDCI